MMERRIEVTGLMAVKRKAYFAVLSCVFCITLAACATRRLPENPIAHGVSPMQQVIVVKEPVPAGIREKCWKEPEVRVENEGPGVDSDGKWYRPAHQSIRMVKGGQWVDCAELNGHAVE